MDPSFEINRLRPHGGEPSQAVRISRIEAGRSLIREDGDPFIVPLRPYGNHAAWLIVRSIFRW
jgi:hypothetical protein